MIFLWGVLLGLAVVCSLASLALGVNPRYDWLWHAGTVCAFAALIVGMIGLLS